MKLYIASSLVLLAFVSQVFADPAATSAEILSCKNDLSIGTYDNGHYACGGSNVINSPGVDGKISVISEGGKNYLKLENGKFICDTKQPFNGGFKVYSGDRKESSCQVEFHCCSQKGDKLKQEPPKPNCIGIYFTETRHYLSAGIRGNPSYGVQSQTWLRTWEYHYAQCSRSSTPQYGGNDRGDNYGGSDNGHGGPGGNNYGGPGNGGPGGSKGGNYGGPGNGGGNNYGGSDNGGGHGGPEGSQNGGPGNGGPPGDGGYGGSGGSDGGNYGGPDNGGPGNGGGNNYGGSDSGGGHGGPSGNQNGGPGGPPGDGGNYGGPGNGGGNNYGGSDNGQGGPGGNQNGGPGYGGPGGPPGDGGYGGPGNGNGNNFGGGPPGGNYGAPKKPCPLGANNGPFGGSPGGGPPGGQLPGGPGGY